MPYLGNTAGNRFVAPKAATQFSGDGSTTAFTLEHSVGSDEDILVSVDGVIQEPSVAYAVSNGTTLTFTAAPSNNSGNNIFVYYLFRTVGTVSHPATNALQATSGTFTGDLTVDTDTLKVDATNDQVGVNTTAMNSYYAKDFVVSAANQGGITVVGGTSDTQYLMFADGTSGADRYRGFIEYSHSADKMSLATNGTGRLVIDSTGAITNATQPAFNVTMSSNSAQFGSGAFQPTLDTEIFDQNADFASNTFTAPVTGRYFLSWMVYAANLDTNASYYYNLISTSNRNYYKYLFTASFDADVAYYGWSVTALADMDANDTATFFLGQNNGHSTSQIFAADTRAMGFLVC